MTRKRFVKMMMANGYGRNEANTLADFANIKGQSYEKAYEETVLFVNYWNGINIEALTENIRSMCETVKKMTIAMSAAAEAFGRAFRDKMAELDEVEA